MYEIKSARTYTLRATRFDLGFTVTRLEASAIGDIVDVSFVVGIYSFIFERVFADRNKIRRHMSRWCIVPENPAELKRC